MKEKIVRMIARVGTPKGDRFFPNPAISWNWKNKHIKEATGGKMNQ